MQLFYTNIIENSSAIIQGQEHIHLSKVLRKREGDLVYVCNGDGFLAVASIQAQTKNESVLKITEIIENISTPQSKLVLAIAPTKSMDRFEWLIEKSIEIGVNEIIPFYSKNSERKFLKDERLQLIAISALKQSKSLFLPRIHPITSFTKVVELKTFSKRFIAYVGEKEVHLKAELMNIPLRESVCVFIGPEGGFAKEEVEFAKSKGIKPVSLGKNRLRTETAAIYAAACYNIVCL